VSSELVTVVDDAVAAVELTELEVHRLLIKRQSTRLRATRSDAVQRRELISIAMCWR
jgi:hypothetical protein